MSFFHSCEHWRIYWWKIHWKSWGDLDQVSLIIGFELLNSFLDFCSLHVLCIIIGAGPINNRKLKKKNRKLQKKVGEKVSRLSSRMVAYIFVCKMADWVVDSKKCFSSVKWLYHIVCCMLQRLDKEGVSFCTRTTHNDNAITNAVEIYDSLGYFTYSWKPVHLVAILKFVYQSLLVEWVLMNDFQLVYTYTASIWHWCRYMII